MTTMTETVLPEVPDRRRTLPEVLRRAWLEAGMLLLFVLLFAGLSAFVPNFLSWVNVKGIALSVATIGIISCTMLYCLVAGDFDLSVGSVGSVGSVVAMSGVVSAVFTNATGSATLGVLAGVTAGGAVGLLNGTVIALLGVNALITTLATMQIVRGLAFIVSGGGSVGVSNARFLALGDSELFGVPTPLWVLVGCFVAFGLLLRQTTFGRDTMAIGGNAEAARLAGIALRRTKVIIFTAQGLVSGLAGAILASRMTSGQPNAALRLGLQVISACVLGGVGTMAGVIVGVLLMGTVQDAMNLLNIPAFYQYVASGGILLAAVLLNRLQQRRAH